MSDKREQKRQKLKKIEADYKRIGQQLSSLTRDEDPETICNLVTEHLKTTDELYPHIKKKLVGSAADARHLKNLIQLSKSTAKRINTPVKFDVGRALRSLRRDLGDRDKLKENIMQECVKKCFMVAPTFEYFYGAIQREGLDIKQRRKRVKVANEDQNVVSVRAAERDIVTECEQDSTPKEVEAIYKKVKNMIISGPRTSVGLIPTLVDPDSFSQTVENIFHTAFLVKEGKVGLKKGPDNKPVLTYEADAESGRRTQRAEQFSQSILSFSMEDYRKWVAVAQASSSSQASTPRRAISNGDR